MAVSQLANTNGWSSLLYVDTE